MIHLQIYTTSVQTCVYGLQEWIESPKVWLNHMSEAAFIHLSVDVAYSSWKQVEDVQILIVFNWLSVSYDHSQSYMDHFINK